MIRYFFIAALAGIGGYSWGLSTSISLYPASDIPSSEFLKGN